MAQLKRTLPAKERQLLLKDLRSRQPGCIHCFVNLLRADREAGMQIGEKRQRRGHFQVALIRNSRIESVGNYPIDKVIKANANTFRRLFFEKVLDRIAVPVLYKEGCALTRVAHCEERLSMMTSRTYQKHSTKWQPCAAMYTVVCSSGLTLSATNIFGGRLGQEASIDSRRIRQ